MLTLAPKVDVEGLVCSFDLRVWGKPLQALLVGITDGIAASCNGHCTQQTRASELGSNSLLIPRPLLAACSFFIVWVHAADVQRTRSRNSIHQTSELASELSPYADPHSWRPSPLPLPARRRSRGFSGKERFDQRRGRRLKKANHVPRHRISVPLEQPRCAVCYIPGIVRNGEFALRPSRHGQARGLAGSELLHQSRLAASWYPTFFVDRVEQPAWPSGFMSFRDQGLGRRRKEIKVWWTGRGVLCLPGRASIKARLIALSGNGTRCHSTPSSRYSSCSKRIMASENCHKGLRFRVFRHPAPSGSWRLRTVIKV
jgi:hypothetical protein